MVEQVYGEKNPVFLGWRGKNGKLYRKKAFAETYGER